MKGLIDKYGGLLIIFIVSIGIGLFIGLQMNPEGGNIYCELTIGKDRQFSLGKNSILDYDLNKLSDEEAAALIVKIENLPFAHYLSKKLRYLSDNGKCVFKKEERNLVVKFIDTEDISGRVAGSCKEYIPYGKRINIFNILEPEGIQKNIKKRMMDFEVVVEMERYKCETGQENQKILWIDKEKGRELLSLESQNQLPEQLLVKATILSTIIQ